MKMYKVYHLLIILQILVHVEQSQQSLENKETIPEDPLEFVWRKLYKNVNEVLEGMEKILVNSNKHIYNDHYTLTSTMDDLIVSEFATLRRKVVKLNDHLDDTLDSAESNITENLRKIMSNNSVVSPLPATELFKNLTGNITSKITFSENITRGVQKFLDTELTNIFDLLKEVEVYYINNLKVIFDSINKTLVQIDNQHYNKSDLLHDNCTEESSIIADEEIELLRNNLEEQHKNASEQSYLAESLLNRSKTILNFLPKTEKLPRDCYDLQIDDASYFSKDVHVVYPTMNKSEAVKVQCTLRGWTVFLHHNDKLLHNTTMLTNSDSIETGFGNPNDGNEYWLGMKWAHEITSIRPNTAWIDVWYKNTSYDQAYFSDFLVSGPSDDYSLWLRDTALSTEIDSIFPRCTQDCGHLRTSSDEWYQPNHSNSSLYDSNFKDRVEAIVIKIRPKK